MRFWNLLFFEKSNHINNLQNQDVSKTPIESHPFKKCDANCDALSHAPAPFLWLRNNIFYCRMELPRVNGKRRYKRFSLHTSNYYEARTLMEKQKQLEKDLQELHRLFNQLDFIEPDPFPYQSSSSSSSVTFFYTKTIDVQVIKTLSSLNPKPLLEKIWNLYQRIKASKNQLSKEDQRILNIIQANQKQFLNQLGLTLQSTITQAIEPLQQQLKEVKSQQPQGPPPHLIGEILNSMLLKGGNCPAEQTRKSNILQMLFSKVGLTVMDDYSKFHHPAIIQKIGTFVKDRTDIKGDNKRKHLRYLKEFVTCAYNIEPDYYKLNVIANLPNIEKTKKADKNSHLPYSKDQLLMMFDPKYDFFKNEPDCFWMCMIALFTGARQNAAFTLQYKDILLKDGLNCIHFIEDHPLKQLKNEASERYVPLHNQLLDLGFVDYVRRKQLKLNAMGTDFIFPKCKTKSGQYNNKYFVRTFSKFLMTVDIKGKAKDGYDFHSFRKNASLIMQAAHIPNSFIFNIIGWEGQNIMDKHYSNHSLAEIKAEMDKFEYDFLKPHFAEWKAIMGKKP